MKQQIIGLDIGGTNIRIGAVDENFNLTNPVKISSKEIDNENIKENLLNFIKNYIIENNCNVKAVSLAFPATINKERSVVISTPNIKYMQNMDFKDYLQQHLNCPVFLEKDACALLFYDIFANSLPLNGISIGIYFGTGIGNAILINGIPLIGENGVACELGHIPVINSTALCGCGLKGCLEQSAGGLYLEKICTNILKTDIKTVFVNYSNHPEILNFIDNMAIAVATEVNILNPSQLVLGGGLLSMNNFPINLLKEKIIEHCRKPLPAETLNMVISGNETPFSGVIGVAIYTQKNHF